MHHMVLKLSLVHFPGGESEQASPIEHIVLPLTLVPDTVDEQQGSLPVSFANGNRPQIITKVGPLDLAPAAARC